MEPSSVFDRRFDRVPRADDPTRLTVRSTARRAAVATRAAVCAIGLAGAAVGGVLGIDDSGARPARSTASTKAGAPVVAPPLTASPVITGRARVIDGDTLDVSGRRIRLLGLDTPEAGETCPRRNQPPWPCGREATRALSDLTRGRSVRCVPHDRDRYGRTVAVCHAGGRDVGAELVRRGLAWAFTRYSRRHVADEAVARRARLGVWQGSAPSLRR